MSNAYKAWCVGVFVGVITAGVLLGDIKAALFVTGQWALAILAVEIIWRIT